MGDSFPAEDRAADLLERRWFAADRAAAEMQAECGALAQVREMADNAWRNARSRLLHLEALRDALGEELSAVDEREPQHAPMARERSVA
jgi:hypothetical protein